MPPLEDWERAAERFALPAAVRGDPVGWFDQLYAAGVAGDITMPWDRTSPHPLLADWVEARTDLRGSALVVGSGLGADAEYLAAVGLQTTAFDASHTAIEQCGLRYPMSTVDYRCADLLHLPAEWQAGFDLVVEISTVQALPPQHHRAAIDAVRSLVAPGGRLLVIGRVPEPAGSGPPPWPLSGTEIESFAADNVRPVAIEQIPAQPPGRPRWRAEFARH